MQIMAPASMARNPKVCIKLPGKSLLEDEMIPVTLARLPGRKQTRRPTAINHLPTIAGFETNNIMTMAIATAS